VGWRLFVAANARVSRTVRAFAIASIVTALCAGGFH